MKVNSPKYLAVILAILLSWGAVHADTTWVAPGEISGEWTAPNSPYIMNGSVTVPAGETLIIQAGVTVFFSDSFNFRVNGLLQVFGTELDSVYFTTDTLANLHGWRGLRFYSSHDSCQLTYTVIENSRSTGPADLRYGGGLEFSFADVRLEHCSIRYNTALIDGGGIYVRDNSAPRFVDCEIHHNRTSVGSGGGALVRSSHPVFENCLIYNNTSLVDGGGLYFRNGAYGEIRGGRIFSNSAVNAGGVGGLAAAVTLDIQDCEISHNAATQNGGGISASSAVILERCILDSNSANQGGGIFTNGSNVTIQSCLIHGHTVNGNGGGVSFTGPGSFILDYCTVANNGATLGGGVYITGVNTSTITSSIVAFNTAGGGVYFVNSTNNSNYRFSGFFGNGGGDLTGTVPPFVGIVDTVNFSLTPCDRFRNVFLDPQFVDAVNGNFELPDGSPCVQAATGNDQVSDVLGQVRPNPPQSQPDMGAIESIAGGDYLYACDVIRGEIGPGNVIVDCDLVLEEGDTLVIQPGTTFSFAGRYEFVVNGLLQGMGMLGDSIRFTSLFADSARDWRGIRFVDSHDSTELNYFIVDRVRGDSYSAPEGCGAVYIEGCSPKFTFGYIQNNFSTFRGGGVACFGGSTPVFQGCVINGNRVSGDEFQDGGGIYSKLSSPEFIDCTVEGNTATHNGGGVYSDSSALLFTGGAIDGNLAIGFGGGIYTKGNGTRIVGTEFANNVANERGGGIYSHSFAVFEDCDIVSNLSFGEGGGLYSAWYGVSFDRCLFDGNVAVRGGGAYCTSSSPELNRCTFVENVASAGGAVECVDATAVINSSIVTLSQGAGFYFQGNSSDCEINYCDVVANTDGNVRYLNGDTTQGPSGLFLNDTLNIRGDSCDTYHNISLDPLFDTSEAFHLTALSPCIHAGDPDLTLDPDGTISDIGAYYFHVVGSPPEAFDLLLPADGDSVDGVVQFCWQRSYDPDLGDPVTYVLKMADESDSYFITVTDTCIDVNLDDYPIADSAEVSWYVTASSLIPDSSIRSTSTRTFVKVPITNAADENTGVPRRFSLHGNYPNPFNATTTIEFEVPRTVPVQLSIFDIQGRQVRVLVNETLIAEVYRVVFDGNDLASGIYFSRMEAGSYMATQKLVLLK